MKTIGISPNNCHVNVMAIITWLAYETSRLCKFIHTCESSEDQHIPNECPYGKQFPKVIRCFKFMWRAE